MIRVQLHLWQSVLIKGENEDVSLRGRAVVAHKKGCKGEYKREEKEDHIDLSEKAQ